MIGALVITHGEIARALISAASSIAGSAESVAAVSVSGKESTDEIREKIKTAMKGVASPEGAILFTDMFGGTPTNIAMSFLEEGRIEVITGVNLPLLLKFLNNRANYGLKELASVLSGYGKNCIVLASEVLKSQHG